MNPTREEPRGCSHARPGPAATSRRGPPPRGVSDLAETRSVGPSGPVFNPRRALDVRDSVTPSGPRRIRHGGSGRAERYRRRSPRRASPRRPGRRSPTATPRACVLGLGFARRGPWGSPIRAVVDRHSCVRALHAAVAMCSGMVVVDTSRRRLRRAATCWGMTIDVARDVAATSSNSRAEPADSATMVLVSPPTRVV